MIEAWDKKGIRMSEFVELWKVGYNLIYRAIWDKKGVRMSEFVELWKVGYNLIYGAIGWWCYIICAALHFFLVYLSVKKLREPKLWKCRLCHQQKEDMVIIYGEEDGLCRQCFDEVTPFAARQGGKHDRN